MITLLQGDCLELMKNLPDGCVDFVFCDPPYGHNNNNGDLISRREAALGKKAVDENEWRPILNDGVEANDIFRQALKEFNRLLKPGDVCCCCCCGGGGPDPQFARWSLWMDEIFDFKQMVVWDKGPMGMGWHYRRSYETVLVAQKRGAACKWYDTSHTVENVIRNIKKIIPNKTQHPTEKPVQLAQKFIELHTKPGDVILDCFMGSGTTGVATIRAGGRSFVGMELDPQYFSLAEQRIRDAQQQPGLL